MAFETGQVIANGRRIGDGGRGTPTAASQSSDWDLVAREMAAFLWAIGHAVEPRSA